MFTSGRGKLNTNFVQLRQVELLFLSNGKLFRLTSFCEKTAGETPHSAEFLYVFA